MKKAVVLLSGGLDSTVVLAKALAEGYCCLALTFDYGQRHHIELESAEKIASYYNVEHRILKLPPEAFAMPGASLISRDSMQKNRTFEEMQSGFIPSTYVPARNTLFIAYAIAAAEIFEADEIHLGPNKLDQNAYPDCRPAFINAFQKVALYATKRAVNGNPPSLKTPLMKMDKQEIVALGKSLNVPLEMTFSCYDPQERKPCGQCDACLLRAEGFRNR